MQYREKLLCKNASASTLGADELVFFLSDFIDNFDNNYTQEMVSSARGKISPYFCENMSAALASCTNVSLQDRKSQLEQDIVMIMEHMSRVSEH